MKLSITHNGATLVLKACPGCGDESYVKPKHNRCMCGVGLVRRTPENKNLNWDELKPEVSRAETRKFLQKAGLWKEGEK